MLVQHRPRSGPTRLPRRAPCRSRCCSTRADRSAAGRARPPARRSCCTRRRGTRASPMAMRSSRAWPPPGTWCSAAGRSSGPCSRRKPARPRRTGTIRRSRGRSTTDPRTRLCPLPGPVVVSSGPKDGPARARAGGSALGTDGLGGPELLGRQYAQRQGPRIRALESPRRTEPCPRHGVTAPMSMRTASRHGPLRRPCDRRLQRAGRPRSPGRPHRRPQPASPRPRVPRRGHRPSDGRRRDRLRLDEGGGMMIPEFFCRARATVHAVRRRDGPVREHGSQQRPGAERAVGGPAAPDREAQRGADPGPAAVRPA